MTNEQRPPQTTSAGGAPGAFNDDEWHALQRIRETYHPVHEFLTQTELARLHFVHWLHNTAGQVAL